MIKLANWLQLKISNGEYAKAFCINHKHDADNSQIYNPILKHEQRRNSKTNFFKNTKHIQNKSTIVPETLTIKRLFPFSCLFIFLIIRCLFVYVFVMIFNFVKK